MSRYDVHYEVLDGHSAQVGAFEADDATLIFDTDSTSSSSTTAFQKLINGIKSRQRKERACSTVLCVGLSLLVIFVLGSLMIASNLKFKHKRGGDDDNNLNFESFDLSEKRALVRRMTREAWAAYKQYAWGHDALRPVAMAPYDEWAGAGASIVGAMSTLYVMGLKGEYLEGREWIAEKLNFSKIDGETDVHATIVQYIGGLLSAYALTGDLVFREKAVEIAAALDVAFNSTTGLPYQYFNPAKGTAYHSKVALSETGHLQPELVYLANIGKNRRLNDRLIKIEAFLKRITKPKGLLLSTVDVDSGNWTSNSSSLSGESNQFTYNLLRAYLQSGAINQAQQNSMNNNSFSFSDTLSPQDLFTLYVQRLLANGLISHSTGGHYTFTGDLDLGSSGSLHSSNQMLTSACNLGAMFALAGHSQVAGQGASVTNAQFWQLGINLTKTCYEATAATRTHLPPAYFIFEEKWGKDVERPPAILVYKSSADVSTLAESYFFLWRLSGDERYREYAWELVQALWRYNRVAASGGYAAIVNVDGLGKNNSKMAFVEDDIQYPQLLSATFKYLYLIFAEQGSSTGPPASLPLSKWVFSEGGHPLPICGQSPAYRAEHCTTVEFNL